MTKPKAFIISLSRIDSSIATANEVKTKLLTYGFDAQLFEGTYGHEAVELYDKDRRHITKYGIKTTSISVEDFKKLYPDITLPPSVGSVNMRTEVLMNRKMEKILRPGVIGCFYSHYRLWQKCVELNEPIFIFEDDVLFERNFIPVEWEDVLLLCTGKDAHMHEYYRPLLYEPSGVPTALPLHNASMPGAVGYGLTPNGAKKLVEAYATDFLPADTAMNIYVVNLQCHSHLMGRAATKEDGKVSLTKSTMWKTFR